MSEMRLSKKQEKSLKKVEYFIPSNLGDSKEAREARQYTDLYYKSVEESPDGLDPAVAFFNYTERGEEPGQVTDKARYADLMSGHKWMAWHEKQWMKMFKEHSAFPDDFEDEPDYIKEMAKRACERAGKEWNE